MTGIHTRIKNVFRHSIMEAILAALCIALAFTAPHFFSTENVFNILRSMSLLGIIAFGMTMVIVSGEIDLSVASQVALSGCLAPWPWLWR